MYGCLSRYQRIICVVVLVCVVYGIYMSTWDSPSIPNRLKQPFTSQQNSDATSSPTPDSIKKDHDMGRVANETLGFEKVFAVSLRERTDKRDALTLMSALSGFGIDWIEGIKPDAIPDKAIPFGINKTEVSDGFLGCWRGHLNAIEEVVHSGISSALIMEDDVDWDVNIKSQLYDIAHGARQIFPDSKHGRPNSPYGDEWDILWLGHCGELFPEKFAENEGLPEPQKDWMSSKYYIHDDDTMPPYNVLSQLVDWSQFPAQTRIVHRTAAPICLFAYAISQRAARALLFAMSVDGLSMAIDNAIAQLCRDSVYAQARGEEGGYGLKCVTVNPAIAFHHRPKGLVSASSDIQSYGKDGEIREKGFTETIMYSTRLNLKNLLLGKPAERQFNVTD